MHAVHMLLLSGAASAPVVGTELRDLPALESHTVFRLNSTDDAVCNGFVYPAPLYNAAPAEWSQPMPPGTYMLQACFVSAPRAEPQSSLSGADIQTIVIAVLTSIFALATLAGVRFGCRFVKNAVDDRKANDANKRKRVCQAVRSVTTMQA